MPDEAPLLFYVQDTSIDAAIVQSNGNGQGSRPESDADEIILRIVMWLGSRGGGLQWHGCHDGCDKLEPLQHLMKEGWQRLWRDPRINKQLDGESRSRTRLPHAL